MLELLKNDPKLIKAYNLYEVLRHKPIEECYENISEAIGKNEMSSSEMMNCFEKFDAEKVISEGDNKGSGSKPNSPLPSFSNSLGRAYPIPIEVKAQDLYDDLLHKSIKESYRSLYKAIGFDQITYSEMTKWFNKFHEEDQMRASKNIEVLKKLNIFKPKIDDSKAEIYRDPAVEPPKFSDFSSEILQKIVKKLDLKTQLVLRKVSKTFRNVVDDQKPAYDFLQLSCQIGQILCVYNRNWVIYEGNERGLDEEESRNSMKIIGSPHYEEMVFDDVAVALKNPKLELKGFRFDCRGTEEGKEEMIEKCYNNIRNLLSSLNHKISIKNFQIRADTPNDILSILPYLEPGYLEHIEISGIGSKRLWKKHVEKVSYIVELDQWKQAKQLTLRAALYYFPVIYLSNFKKIVVYTSTISLISLIHLRKYFSRFAAFELCIICTRNIHDFEEFADQLGDPIISRNAGCLIRHHPIPDTDQILEIELDIVTKSITIKKKNSM